MNLKKQLATKNECYIRGDKVKHKDKVWILEADTSAYEPGTTHSGWIERVEP